MKKQLSSAVIIMTVMLTLGACATKQSAVDRLEKFSYELRDNGEYYSVSDWKKAAEEFIKIRKEINKHDYTAEERKKIGQLEGQCAANVAKGVKGKITNLGNEINGILQGVLGGMAED